jgi:hypothetical protein
VVDLSGPVSDFPAIHSSREIDVCNDCAVFPLWLARRVTASSPDAVTAASKPPSVKVSSTKSLESLVVFRDQDKWKF